MAASPRACRAPGAKARDRNAARLFSCCNFASSYPQASDNGSATKRERDTGPLASCHSSVSPLSRCKRPLIAFFSTSRVGTWIDETLFEPNGGAIGSDQLHFPTQGKVLVLYRVFEEDPMLSRISLLLLTIASLTLTAYFGAEAWRASDGTLPSPLTKRSSLYR